MQIYWYISGRMLGDNSAFIITNAKLDHTCSDMLHENESKRLNPSIISTFIEENVWLDPNFMMFFIAYKACRDGFKHRRPMLFVDATTLKGRFKG